MLFSVYSTEKERSDLQLWYNAPVQNWNEALPVGNGLTGAMIFGDVTVERLQINESTLYSGEPDTRYTDLDIRPLLSTVYNLIKEKKYAEAHKLVKENWQGRLPQSYQPLGDLYIDFEHSEKVTNYKRTLDIENSLYKLSYEVDGNEYHREIFASYPDSVIVVKLSSSSDEKFAVKLNYTSEHPTAKLFFDKNIIGISGQAPGYCERRTLDYLEKNGLQDRHPELFDKNGNRKHNKQLLYGSEIDGRGMYFTSQAKVIKGDIKISKNEFRVEGKGEIIILIAAATSYNGVHKSPSKEGRDYMQICSRNLEAASKKHYENLFEAHRKDYQSLFNKVDLKIESDKDYSVFPTGKRVGDFKNNGDNDLISLLFQYGRYLLIASSRQGGQPANLQGLWNNDRIPPWNCGYTMNINAEMNYWLAETTGLSECLPPFFEMIKEFSVTGKAAAANMYGLPGWVAHHNASIWREAYPSDGEPTWFFWNMSGGWLCRHLWEHYLFTGDKFFLAEEAYPLMKGAAEFYNAWLVQDENGYWITPVSTSPENYFLTEKKEPAALSSGAAMDRAIVAELFENVESAIRILNKDEEFAAELKLKRENLFPYQIGKNGQLQEWQYDFEEYEPHHRHLSHLYGFYPGCEITFKKMPELIAPIRKTLELRGDEATGWSMGWKINMWARMRDGNHAYKIIRNLFTLVETDIPSVQHGGLYPNLLDAHPPFQIDGNFGFTAGVAEMLLQSHSDELHILPALPDVWKNGRVKGLCARGGFVLDIYWTSGELSSLVVKSNSDNMCNLRIKDKTFSFQAKAGETYTYEFTK